MDVAVTRTADGWVAHRGEVTIGRAAALVRPDSRCFVVFGACRAEALRPLVAAIAHHLRRELYTEIGEADVAALRRLVDLGFVVNRREHIYTLPTDPASTGLAEAVVPVGFEILTADRVHEDRLRQLDDELRQDVPGTDGWRWDARGFREQTYDAPDFDPATYLVAIEQATGRCAGLVRVWIRPGVPRLGLIGVGRDYRRRGLARLLLAQVLGVLHQRGEREMTGEVDTTNAGSNRLLTGIGARRTGGFVELMRPWPAAPPPGASTRSTG
jgi:ribosomal protein S18 acetylase RimI-like enzyme